MDIGELIRLSKEKESTKLKESMEQKQVTPTSNKTKVTLTDPTDITSAEHGEYIETEDGVGGIVVENDHMLKELLEIDQTRKAIAKLNSNDRELISDLNWSDNDYGEDAPEGYDPGSIYIKKNHHDPKVQSMIEIKEGFSKLSLGLPNHGLVPADSDEARLVQEALDKVRSGEIILPTPEEYEEQKAEAERKRKERQERLLNGGKKPSKKKPSKEKEENPAPVEEPIFQDTLEQSSDIPEMGDLPENMIIKRGVDEQLAKLEQATNETVVNVKPKAQRVETPTEVQNTIPEPVETKEPELLEVPEKRQPINLVEYMIEEEEENQEEASNEKQEETVQPNEVTEINVPVGEAETLIQNMPLETYDKMVASKVIRINEVELKDVPVGTRRISRVEDYKMLAKRRKPKSAEVTERVLINSGFVIFLNAATSLEMATIFKSPLSNTIDWEKEYQFCYEHTVGTSIGKLSYNEFVLKVHPTDIETILDGIYELSETDTRDITIDCDAEKGCGQPHDVKVKISELPDLNSLPKESIDRIKYIVASRHDLDKAKEIQSDSPTMVTKCIQIGDRTVIIRSTTGPMIIERIDRVDDLMMRYGAIVPMLLMYISEIRITYQEREDVKPDVFVIDSVDLLCEEIKQFTDEELEIVRQVIANDIKEYQVVTYSIKGPITCPNCGHMEESIPCTISSLVFQKTQSVLG